VRVLVTTGDGRSASQDVLLAPEAVKEIEVALTPLAAVAGRLIDAASRAPIQDAFLFVDTARSPQSDGSRSDASGRFQLRVAAGDHVLHSLLPRYKGLKRPFAVEAGQQVELGDVAMQRQTVQPGTVGVTLQDDSAQGPAVTSVVPDGPAEQAGVQVGDHVAMVDGMQVKRVADAIRRLGGAPGSSVQVVVQRGATARALTITRATP
jgi:S1-C subfamily serine protease